MLTFFGKFFKQKAHIQLFICLISLYLSFADENVNVIDGRPSTEFRGYYKREHSLIKPYQSLS